MTKKLYKLMNWADIEGIVYSEEDNPHRILGAHPSGLSTLVQFFYPGAVKATVITEKNIFPCSWRKKDKSSSPTVKTLFGSFSRQAVEKPIYDSYVKLKV